MKSPLQLLILITMAWSLLMGSKAADRIARLPGQPAREAGFGQFAGYITVDDVLCLGDQQECSNLGGFLGNGPFSPVSGDVLARNRYAFNKEVNVKYLDSPVGTGFSYSANISHQPTLDDSIIDSKLLQSLASRKEASSEGNDVCLRVKISEYLNGEDVQKALHVTKTNWIICSMDFDYDKGQWENTTIDLVGSLVERGIRVLIDSVDEMTFVPFLGTRVLVNDLAKKVGLNTTVAYQGWFDSDNQVGGWKNAYGEALTYASIRGGSAKVPKRSLSLLQSFVARKLLSTAG